ncbi:hypothetical protein BTUL_0135g00210 [Botrytis tulipae]|uniref:Uncharacterized protein n=1 Tax=Botrytis tulipae TaxID=87230 RepID=A0A4Z1EN65_9HELO|nr:hypothetical protein BTUL_0135g00210 [Botrytis tulipae]
MSSSISALKMSTIESTSLHETKRDTSFLVSEQQFNNRQIEMMKKRKNLTINVAKNIQGMVPPIAPCHASILPMRTHSTYGDDGDDDNDPLILPPLFEMPRRGVADGDLRTIYVSESRACDQISNIPDIRFLVFLNIKIFLIRDYVEDTADYLKGCRKQVFGTHVSRTSRVGEKCSQYIQKDEAERLERNNCMLNYQHLATQITRN